jgi:hypothetical protein
MAPSAEWQTGGALQTFGVPATHAPDWHVSAPLHALPSEQLVPFAASGYVHWPVAGSHVAPLLVRQTGGLLQSTGVPAVHWPATHVSLPLQRSLSAHEVPSAALGYVHWPVLGLHVAPVAVWHGGGLLHTTAVPAEHTPFWQVSAPSQALPFEQGVPFATFECVQPSSSQRSAVQGLLSLQFCPEDAVQVPSWQVAVSEQSAGSLQGVPFPRFG